MDLEQEIYEFLAMSERAYGKIYPEALKAVRARLSASLQISHEEWCISTKCKEQDLAICKQCLLAFSAAKGI